MYMKVAASIRTPLFSFWSHTEMFQGCVAWAESAVVDIGCI